MDPNKALRVVRVILKQYWISETIPDADLPKFMENLEALDGWLSAGGFLPKAWERSQ